MTCEENLTAMKSQYDLTLMLWQLYRGHVVTLQARKLGASEQKPCVSAELWSWWKQSAPKGLGLKGSLLHTMDIHAFICTTPCWMLPPLIHHTANISLCEHRWCTVTF